MRTEHGEMRVCIVTTAFPRWPGDDRGVFILEAAQAIQSQGLQVRVVAMHSPGAKTHEVVGLLEVFRPRYLWPERLEVLQKEGGGLPIVWRKSRLARLALLPFMLAHTLAIMRYAHDCDVIHANWTLSAAAAGIGHFYHRRPIVTTVHGSDIFQATRLRFISSLTRRVLDRSSQVIAVSNSLADAVAALGLPARQIEVIPDGVDIERFCPPAGERERLIVFVGSLIERKGLRYLIQAMPRILERQPDFHLAIIGEGPLESELVNLAHTLQLSEKVRFVGRQSPEQVSQWMQRAKLFVLPSVEEGLGVVLLEALASGTPCVASRVGGIPTVVSSDVGILVPPADPIALATSILSFLDDHELWNAASRNARARAVEDYSWAKIAARLIAVYRSSRDNSVNAKRRGEG